MSADSRGVRFLRHGLRFAQREHGAARVSLHAADGALTRKILKGRAPRGAEHDQAGVALGRAIHSIGSHGIHDLVLGAAGGAGFIGSTLAVTGRLSRF